jgi:hypothetical protein
MEPPNDIDMEPGPQENPHTIQDEMNDFLGDIVSKNNQNTLLLDRVFKAEVSNDK